jgi:peptidoglycan LD-endopeptidase LytH
LTVLGMVFTTPVKADTKTELARAKARLAALRLRIQAETGRADRLQREATVLAARMNAVRTKIALAADRLDALVREMVQAGSELLALQEQLGARAWAAYEAGPGNTIELLLGSSSFSEFTDRLEFLDKAQRSDRDLVIQTQHHRNELIDKQQQVRALQERLAADQRNLVSQQKLLQAKLADAQATLLALDGHRAEAQSLVQRLADRRQREIEAARLAAAEARGRSGPPGSGPFRICPVDQPRAYSNDFGVPRPGGRRHQGIDIFAPEGTPIRAPFPGVAVDSSNDVGGLAVKVLGGRGFVYNAHLSAIGNIGSVSVGTVIGYVGSTGNARGTPPHDHFEWHPGNGGAVNPYAYLNQVC